MNPRRIAFAFALAVASAAVAEDIVDTTGGITINVDAGTVVRAEKFIGNGRITKTGAGTLVLTNPNSSFTGGIVIQAGPVQADAAGAFGSGPVSMGTAAGDGAIAVLNAEGATFANDFGRSYNHGALIKFLRSATITGTVEASGGCSVQGEGICVAEGATATIAGALAGCSGKEFCVTGGGTLVLQGVVTMPANLRCSGTTGARIQLWNPQNSFTGQVDTRGTRIVCCAANVLNNANIYYNDDIFEDGGLDLNGYDQTVKTISMNTGKRWKLGEESAQQVIASEKPATLTVKGVADATHVAQARFRGQVSLVVDADPTYTLALERRHSDTAGTLTAKSGTLQFGVAGGGMPTSFKSIQGLVVGAAGKVAFLDGTPEGIFAPGELDLALTTGGELNLPGTLTVRSLTVDGEPKIFGSYAAANCPPIVAGTVVIPSQGVVAAAWTGAGGVDDGISSPVNWRAESDFDFTRNEIDGSFAESGARATIDSDVVFSGLALDAAGGFAFVGEKTMSIGAGGISVSEIPEAAEPRRYTFAAPSAFVFDQTWTVPAGNALAFSNMRSPFPVAVTKGGAGGLELSGTNVIDGRLRIGGGTNVLSGVITTTAGAGVPAVGESAELFCDCAPGETRLAGVEIDKPVGFRTPNAQRGFGTAAGTMNVIRGELASSNESGQRLFLREGSTLVLEGGLRQSWALDFEGTGTLVITNKPYYYGSSMSLDAARASWRDYAFILRSDRDTSGALTAVIAVAGNKADFFIPSGSYGGTFDFRVSEAAAPGYYLRTGSRSASSAAFVRLNATTQTFAKVVALRGDDPSEITGHGAALRVNGDGLDSEITADVSGNVSILKEGTGTLTLGANGVTKGAFASTGDIVVSGGTLTFGEGASWLNGSNVVVRGTGTLVLPANRVFSRGLAKMRLDDEGALSIPDGATCRVRGLWVDGEEIPAGTYSRASGPEAVRAHLADTTGVLAVCGGGSMLIVR